MRAMARLKAKSPVVLFRTNGDPTLTILDEDWERIENAYTKALRPNHRRQALSSRLRNLRKEIYQLTYSYLYDLEGENHAESISISAMVERAELIKLATATYRETIFDRTLDAAEIHTDCMINRGLKEIGVAADNDALGSLNTLILHSIETVCDQVLTELSDPKSHRQGAPEHRYIVALTKLFEKHELPAKVSKSAPDKTAFVQFFRELQKCIPLPPAALNRRDGTLAQTIIRARRRLNGDT
jgi:hypothetical protein